jgi:GLPGLI family protein
MKIIFAFLFICFCTKAIAQKYLIEYSIPNIDETNTGTLIINDSISTFTIKQTPTTNRDGYFVKNSSTGRCFYSEKIMNQTFKITDSVHSMKWELLNDTAHILNEICLAARTNFRGREYLAYYSTNYPVSNGPWKFGGLPGLILLVKSTDKYVEWKAEKIVENYSGDIPYKNIDGLTFMKWDDFEKKYKETVSNYIKLVRSNGSLAAGAKATLKIESVEIFYPELQTGKGITF